MSFAYDKVLIIGATSGIGKALATKLVENGTQLIIAGRRKENLDAFVQDHGPENVTAKVLDIMQLNQVGKLDPTDPTSKLIEIDSQLRFTGGCREPRLGLHFRQLRYPTTI